MKAEMTLEDLLDDHIEEVADVTRNLRDLVRRCLPDAEETIYRGWHGIGYRHPAAGYVCGIFPRATRVDVALEHGRQLASDEAFDRVGNQVGFLSFESWDEGKTYLVEELLDRAV
jgi:hypothetical protein